MNKIFSTPMGVEMDIRDFCLFFYQLGDGILAWATKES